MKKKLLITMGCSFTEGYGCWDETTFSSEMLNKLKSHTPYNPFFGNDNSNIKFHTTELISKNINNFQSKGWPANLAKLMGTTDILNLGKGASSNSGQTKEFFKRNLHENPYAEYDVTLVWLMTEPFRISFYVNRKIENYMIDSHPIWKEYFKEIISHHSKDMINGIPVEDATLESIFYFNIMETVCIKNNWKFHAFPLTNAFSGYFRKHESSDNFHENCILPLKNDNNSEFYSHICGHLNEAGYSHVANNMYNIINT
jgi:hypothetical protein